MKIYVPPLEEGVAEPQRAAYEEIVDRIGTYADIVLLPAPEDREELNWLANADAVIAEATTLDPNARREALYAGEVLGKHVLLLCTTMSSRDAVRNSFDEQQQNALWIAAATNLIIRHSAIQVVIDQFRLDQKRNT